VPVNALNLHDVPIGNEQTRAGPGIGSEHDSVLALQGASSGTFLDLISNVIGVTIVLGVHLTGFHSGIT
jgi:hypothetical protein